MLYKNLTYVHILFKTTYLGFEKKENRTIMIQISEVLQIPILAIDTNK